MNASELPKLLVVADEPETITEIAANLGCLGENAVAARSGREALRRLLTDDFAAVLVQMGMAEMGGLETAARIRRRKRSEDTPILLIAGTAADVASVTARGLEGVEVIEQPIDPNVLTAKVAAYVDLFQKTESIRRQSAQRVELAQEQAARQTAEKAMRRSALLAEASRVLSRSLDVDATLRSLRRAVTPALADVCQLMLYDPNGDLWFAPADPEDRGNHRAGHRSTSRVQTVDSQLARIVRDAVTSGRAQSVSAEVVRSAPNLRRKRGWPSVVIAPLIARDIPLGAIICCRRGSRRRFGPAEIALLADVAGRAATALDNARLFQTIREGERRKDEFLAMLGHELRNPLAAIANAGELTKLLKGTDPSLQEALEIIRQQASLMKRLVDDLLDVSRITSGRVQLQKSRVSVSEVMARVAESTGTLFTSRNHTLHLSVPDERLEVDADPFRLEQILSNLMVNAAEYTEPGGRISFSAAREAREIVFRVKDSGMGIGADLLPNVFDLFSQADRTLHRAEGGLGIGLTIVRGLTELHGGRVWATSEGTGRGAEFVVCLPAACEAAEEPLAPAAAGRELLAPRRRVLVVEDQPALLYVTVALLRKLGHEVRAAVDGREALLAVKEYRPDVVFLDIGLPGMDGYEVAHSLRSELGESTPLLVAMTGYGEHEVDRHAAKARFDHHLVKPADVKAMQSLLARVG
jgi:signal transduction histidine kinase/DNA-binding response OmpR family regulator